LAEFLASNTVYRKDGINQSGTFFYHFAHAASLEIAPVAAAAAAGSFSRNKSGWLSCLHF
jgi:hypothetical protein